MVIQFFSLSIKRRLADDLVWNLKVHFTELKLLKFKVLKGNNCPWVASQAALV
jgi:hypothetical protein